MEGFLLGFASGTICLTYCAPVFIPFLLTEGNKTIKNYLLLFEFLLGRLFGYLMFGVIAFFMGKIISSFMSYRNTIYAIVYIILSLTLILYVFSKSKKCSQKKILIFISKHIKNQNSIMPLLTGFLTGLNLCPPFVAAFSDASNSRYIFESIFFMFTFFLGSSLYFIPIPLLGFIKNKTIIPILSKLILSGVAIYYLYLGLKHFIVI